jgi:hypothetical protein
MATRKGSLKLIDVPIDVLDRLNSGAIETVNLAECLVVDFTTLMAQVIQELPIVAKSRIQSSLLNVNSRRNSGIRSREYYSIHRKVLTKHQALYQYFWRTSPLFPGNRRKVSVQ